MVKLIDFLFNVDLSDIFFKIKTWAIPEYDQRLDVPITITGCNRWSHISCNINQES